MDSLYLLAALMDILQMPGITCAVVIALDDDHNFVIQTIPSPDLISLTNPETGIETSNVKEIAELLIKEAAMKINEESPENAH